MDLITMTPKKVKRLEEIQKVKEKRMKGKAAGNSPAAGGYLPILRRAERGRRRAFIFAF